MLFLLACAPQFSPLVLSGAGYEEIVLDVAAAGVDADDVQAAMVAGIPAFDVRTTGSGSLALSVQGGPAGTHDVVVQTKTESAVTVGVVEYLPPHDPIFERTAAIGASITMGFQDGATGGRAQLVSPPALVAQTVGAWMPLPLLQPGTGRCKASCPSAFYADPSGECLPCDPSCAECTGPGATSCSSCDPIGGASHLRAGACVDSCGDGY